MTGEIAGSIAETPVPGQTHEFVRVGNYYVSSGLNVIQFGRYLWQQLDQFLGSEGKSRLDRHWEGTLSEGTLKAIRTVRQMAGYLLARSGSRSTSGRNGQVLSLPVRGDIAIVRRSGAVKVLDIRNRQVFTVVVDDQERAKLRERVELSQSVSHLPFAPKVWQVDLQRGYFSEEFLSGSHPVNFAGCRDDFGKVYLPLLSQFLTSFEPSWEEMGSYAESLRDDIVGPEGLLGRMKPEEQRKVSGFVERIYSELAGDKSRIPLVLSHGDYFSGNIVINDSGYRAIDWANTGFRSPLHDLYYLYMNHCCRVLDWHSVKRRTATASEKLKQALGDVDAGRLRELAPYLAPSDRLRKLFYLECVQVPLVRCSDPSDRYLASMLVRIGWFEAFDQAMQEKHVEERSRHASEVRAAARLDGGA